MYIYIEKKITEISIFSNMHIYLRIYLTNDIKIVVSSEASFILNIWINYVDFFIYTHYMISLIKIHVLKISIIILANHKRVTS